MCRESPSKVCVEIINHVMKEYEKMFGELSSNVRNINKKIQSQVMSETMEAHRKEYEKMFGDLSSDDGSSNVKLCADGKEYFVMNSPYDKIVNELRDTYIAKNADYGNSFEKSVDEFGVISAIVRMSDKMERLKSLTVNNALDEKPMVDESILDTTKDLANYAIMLAMYLEKEVEDSETY